MRLGNRRRWEFVRRAVFDRDGWLCVACGRPGRLEADHVRALQAGGEPWALDNLQTLCRGCHVSKTAAENRRELPPGWRALCDELRRGL